MSTPQPEATNDMWDAEYQRRRNKVTKAIRRRSKDYADSVCEWAMKHMIHFFILAIILSFAFMLKLVAMESKRPDWAMEDSKTPEDPFVKFVASFIGSHPIYYFINNGLAGRGYNITAAVESASSSAALKAISDTMMLSNDPGRFILHPMYVMLQEQSPMGMMRQFEITEVDTQYAPLSVAQFYADHVSQSLPCLFKNDLYDNQMISDLATLQGPDLDQYLIQKFSMARADGIIAPPVHYKVLNIDAGWIIRSRRTFTKEYDGPMADFLQYKNAALPRKQVFYIKDMPITQFPNWAIDKVMYHVRMQMPLSKILQPVDILYTQWADFEPRRPWKVRYEQQVCLIKGRERFRIVSPIFRKNIYVGQLEHLEADESPMDFFNPDYDKFPYAKQFKFVEVELQPGDCMYIPAYFYVQSKTTADPVKVDGQSRPGESILLTWQFESHAAIVDVMLDALEADILTDDQLHKYDAMLAGA